MIRMGLIILALGSLLADGRRAGAVPFVLGDEVCGSLSKTRLEDGSVAWKVVDCPPLEQLAKCGDGVLGEHEACDRALPESCPGKKVCVACQACVRAAAAPTPQPPTPTPAPAPPTPTPLSDCSLRELAPLGTTGFLGIDFVQIAEEETHTYCFSVATAETVLEAIVVDRTGGAQCSWFSVTLHPPVGSGRQTRTSEGRDVTFREFSPTGLPQGIWRVSVKALAGGSCAQRYLFGVRY